MPPCRYIPEAVIGGCTIGPPATTVVVVPPPATHQLPRTGADGMFVAIAMVCVAVGSGLCRFARC